MQAIHEIDKRLLQRKIIHIDMDAFFASVEERENPELAKVPLVIGGSPQSRGVVCTANYTARKFGIRSAMPCATAFKKCPKAVFIPPRHSLYADVSKQVFEIIKSQCDSFEAVSIDEAYMEVTEISKGSSATEHAEKIRSMIYEQLNLTASAGVAPNKMLAKIASDMNKPNGLTVIKPHHVDLFVRQLPVEKINGIGPAMQSRLSKIGIKVCGDLQAFELNDLLVHFGERTAEWLYNRCRGIDDRKVESKRIRKSIGVERTYSKDISSPQVMQDKLFEISEKLMERCKCNGKYGLSLCLKIKFNDFSVQTRTASVPIQLDSLEAIDNCWQEIFHSLFIQKPVRLLGLSVSRLQDSSSQSISDAKRIDSAENLVQPSLFSMS